MKSASVNRSGMRSAMAGMTLIELMISLTLALVITGAVGYVYLASSRTYHTQDAFSRMQEGARYAFEFMGKDLRMTGVTGCSFTTSANAINSDSDWYKDLFDRPLRGTDDTAPTNACITADTAPCYIRGDALISLHANVSEEHIVTAHNTGASQLTLNNATGISAGNLMVATDCVHASAFQASAVVGTVVSHATGGTPGNSTANLGAGGAVYSYTAGSRVFNLNAVAYYIGTNPSLQPALYRLAPAGVNATPTAEELVEGVEDMQITYGVDTGGTPDGEVDFVDPDGDGDPYLTVAQVESAAVPGGTNDLKWERVVSVRISLLMRTTDDGVTSTPQTYTFNGANTTAGDRRLRKVYTHVIKVRNR